MSYQPLYATCWDDLMGNGHTSSRRGIVKGVGMDCNTKYGKCVEVSVGYNDGKEDVDRPDLRRFKKNLRGAGKQKYLDDVDRETKISVNISLKENAHFNYRLDGVEINPKVLKLLKNGSEDFLAVVDRLLKSIETKEGRER